MKKDILGKLSSIVLIYYLLCTGYEIKAAHYYQPVTITGIVTDHEIPVPGVNIVIKNSTFGVVTDEDGKYTITVPDENTILVFSFVGYQTKEIKVGALRKINMELDEDTHEFEEIMVVAYGTARKSSYTGSAAVIGPDRLDKISGTGFVETLQGMSAGLNIVNNEGSPGADSRVQIRGIGSINASSNPLYVVDGMPYDGILTSITPSDIESITVLKDASASSLYGSRAANGVIVITTRKGKSDKPQVNFRAAWGTSDLAVKNPVKADPYEHLTNTWEGIYNDKFYRDQFTDADARKWASDNVLQYTLRKTRDSNGYPVYVSPFKYTGDLYVLETGEINPALEMVWDESDYDWYGAAYSRKLRQEYSLDVSGRSNEGRLNYFFSGSFLDDNGYGLSQYFKRYSFRTNISAQVTPWMEAGGNISYSSSRQNSSGFIRALLFSTTMASPWLRNNDNTDWVYSEKTGVRMFDFGSYINNFYNANPLMSSGDYWDNPNDYSFGNVMRNMVTSRFHLKFDLPWKIQFKTNVSIDDISSKSMTYNSAVHGADQLSPYGVTVRTSGGSASRMNNRINSLTWNNLLVYDQNIGHHSLDILLGQEIYSLQQYYDYSFGGGIMQLGQFELASATKNWSVNSYRNKYALLSFLGKINYGYRNRYYLSLSVRSDGSSKFEKSNRWGNFFSVGGAWRLSSESFMNNLKWLDNLFFRATYGVSGNDKLMEYGNVLYYAYQAYYEQDNMYEKPGLKPASVATPDLKWEKNVQTNLALDFRLFHMFSGTFEYYYRRSKDLLYFKNFPLSAQVGSVTGINTNLGDLENQGFEITLNADLIDYPAFSWSIDANWSATKNKIIYLPDGAYTYDLYSATYKIAEGHSLYEFYMPGSAGVDPQTGNALYLVYDESGNEVVTDDFSAVTMDDYRWQGSPLPKGYGSVTNRFRFRNIDLSFMFYYSYGGKLFDNLYMERVTLRSGVGVIQDLVEDRWRKPGDQAYLPRWSNDDYLSTRRSTDFWIFNNNYIRLRNLTLGYSFPEAVIGKVNISGLRIYLSGDNLLTFGSAARRYSDPETGISGNNYNGDGDTNKGYPGSRRVFMGGIQVTF